MNGLFPEAFEASKFLTSVEKLNCSLSIPANFSSNLVVYFPEDLNQWRLKDQLSDERIYVIYNHNLNAFIKAPFGVATAFLNDPNPFFSSKCNSQEPIASSCNTSLFSETKLKSCTTKISSTTTDRASEFHFPNRYPTDKVPLGN